MESLSTPASAASDPRGGRLLLGALASLAVARFWIAPLGSSLWLDEFGTHWVTNGGFGQLWARARTLPQSLPYAAVVTLARALGGSREIALRLPSLIAAGLAAVCLYRLCLEILDRRTAFLAVLIFVTLPKVSFAAHEARPYALAVLTSIVALWMLVRWLERGRDADAMAYVLFAVATVYCQYLFATTLAVHALYAWRRWREGGPVRARRLLLIAAAIGLLTAPAAVLVLRIDRRLHGLRGMPGIDDFISALVPSRVVDDLLLSLFAAWLLGWFVHLQAFPPEWEAPREGRAGGRIAPQDALWLLLLSIVVPVILLFATSRILDTPVFTSRYMLAVAPGVALLAAWLIRTAQPTRGQTAIAAGYLLIVLLQRGAFSLSRRPYTDEDWRGALAAIRAANGDHPVLVSGTFVESLSLAALKDPEHLGYMRAPVDFYPTGGQAVILPFEFSRAAESYVERLLGSTPGLEDRFALIERENHSTPWVGWIDGVFQPRGYSKRQIWDHGLLRAWVFERSAHRVSSP